MSSYRIGANHFTGDSTELQHTPKPTHVHPRGLQLNQFASRP